MTRKLLELLGFAAISLLWLSDTGCSSSAVGDPCIPERVQEGGFEPSETYFETSSVQCATRVCLVRGLAGDPNDVRKEDGTCPSGAEFCPSANDIERSVYCSCRCGAPEGSGVPTCGCPGGFICEPILQTGGDGLRGSYCVRDPTLEIEE